MSSFCCVLSILIWFIISTKSYKIEVTVTQGTVLGTRAFTIFDKKLFYAFYGIPYARKPIRELRFKDPKPPLKWKRPYDARNEYNGACAQAHIVHKHGLFGTEDCLRLNVYTPNLPRYSKGEVIEKPVVVWVHGYSFASSFSHIYGADFLIDNDVIFISVTHRIGVFGFLKVNNTSSDANMGLKDIVMALKWIRRNVKKFGGDKNQITVMGSGSGGTFLSLLLMTKYRKMFSKMILQSGVIFSPSILQNDPVLERTRLIEELKKITPNKLNNASAKDIILASLKIQSNRHVINNQRSLVPFTPIIELHSKESLIVERPEEFYSDTKTIIDKPILVGFNTQESISEVIPFLRNPNYLKSFTSFFKFMVPFSSGCKYNYTSKKYMEVSNKIINKYFKDGISEKSVKHFLRYVSDLHKYPIYKFIKTLLNINNNKIFVYKFNYVGTLNAVKATSIAEVDVSVKGAASGDEICYILKCEPLWETYVKIKTNESYNIDVKFIKQMTSMWSNFVKASNPTPSTYFRNFSWPPMSLKEDNVLHIGKVTKLTDSKQEEKMFSFWNKIYDSYYSSENCKINKHDEL